MRSEGTALREFAPAKINLTLHVEGRRADGYHLLDSIVVFASVGDWLTCTPAEATALRLNGAFAGGLEAERDNLVLRAARKLDELYPGKIAPVVIDLEKNLPVASGIGGGSADAAAAMRALLKMSGLADDLHAPELAAAALKLGADVPVCLAGRSCRMQGIGEALQPIGNLAPVPALLVNPGCPVSTAAIFSKLGLAPGERCEAERPGFPVMNDRGRFFDWLQTCRNDLEAPACAVEPRIADCLSVLREMQAVRLARMSGSGATCFALFDQTIDAEVAAEDLKRIQPDWWITTAKLG